MSNPLDGTTVLDSSIATIPSNYSRVMARVLGLQERDLHQLLAFTSLSVEEFMQEDTLFTALQQLQITQNALQLSDDDTIALQIGRKFPAPTHGAMGFLINSSPDLLTAIKAIEAYAHTRMNFIDLSVVVDDDWVELICDFKIELSPDIYQALCEVAAGSICECAEFIVGRPLTEAIITLAYDKPGHGDRYSEFLPTQVEFSQEQSKIKIPKELCLIPNASSNPENYLFAMQQCEAMKEKLLSNTQTTQYQLQKLMLAYPLGALSEEEAAAALFISKRTLARRLKDEGTSFRQIREDMLSQQAADFLQKSDMSVEAVAALLNYHDSANFRRAFKRWFGMTPDQYRKQSA